MKSRIEAAEPTVEAEAAEQMADDTTVDGHNDGAPTGHIGRRGVLGAVAAGAFLAACGNSAETTSSLLSDTAGTSGPSTTGVAGATAATPASGVTAAGTPAATGTEVVLPTPAVGTAAPSPQVLTVDSTNGAAAAPSATPATGTDSTIGSSPAAPASSAPASTKPVMVVEDPATATTVPPAATPTETAPAATAPAETAPAQTTPAQTAPAETTPAETTPPQTAAPTTQAPPITTPVANGALVDLVVSRLTFGYTPGMRAAVGNMGPQAFINDQLSKNTPDPAAERLAAAIPGIADRTFSYNGDRQSRAAQLRRLGMSNLVRATNSEHQLFEVMTRFWADHFNVQADESELTSLNLARHYQEYVIRPNAMGKFRDLLHAVIRSPAMLEYLDQAASDANSPEGVNENLGREILELHSLGIDENERHIYTETDVQQASLALAGMTYRRNNNINGYYEFYFRKGYAYDGAVSLLGGQWTNEGLSGLEAADSMITFLANHPQTARYISYKLCRRFVADFPSTSLVESTAAVFQANDTAIVPTLAHIFSSDEFTSSSYQKYRTPFEFNVAAVRAVGSNVVNGTDHEQALDFLERLGHLPWQHPTPDGYPDIAIEWITAGGMQDRWNLAGNLARGKTPMRVNKTSYLPVEDTVDELINQLAIQFGIGTLDAADRQAIATGGGVSGTDSAAQLNNKQVAMVTGLVLSHPLFQTR